MLAGVPVSAESTAELAGIVRAAGADVLPTYSSARSTSGRSSSASSRIRRDGLAELPAVLMNEHQWRQREGLDS